MNAISQILPRVNLRNLSIMGYANGCSQHHYRANRISDVLREGFFEDARSMLKQGDFINVSAVDGGALFFVGHNGKVISMCWCEDAS